MLWKLLAKDSAIYGGADFLSKLLAFFTFPLIAAALSPKAFGTLELVVTATTLLGLAANCGLNNSLQRFYWDQDTLLSDRPLLVSGGLMAKVVLVVVAIVAGAVALLCVWPFIQSQDVPLSWIAIAAALVLMGATQVTQYLLDVIRLHMAPWRFLSVALVSRVLTAFVGVIVVVWFHQGLDGLLLAQMCVALAVVPWAMFAVRVDLVLETRRELVTKLLKFGYPFIFSSLAFWLFGSMDRWMLASMSSVEEVGIYSVAFRFASMVMFVSLAFGQAWSPLAIKLRTEHPGTYRDMYVDILMVFGCGMLIFAGGVAVFSQEIIDLLMPKEYSAAALPMAILCLGIVLQATQHITAVGISIAQKPFIFARLAWITTALNFILNWLLIPSFGAVGSAWATALTYLALTSGYLYFSQKLHPLPLDKKKILLWLLAWTLLVLASSPWVSRNFTPSIAIGIKVTVLLICLTVGYKLAPLKRINHVR
jgi:O-antigen/teichoic acid export membrane protein